MTDKIVLVVVNEGEVRVALAPRYVADRIETVTPANTPNPVISKIQELEAGALLSVFWDTKPLSLQNAGPTGAPIGFEETVVSLASKIVNKPIRLLEHCKDLTSVIFYNGPFPSREGFTKERADGLLQRLKHAEVIYKSANN